MPIYEYRCPNCNQETEVILPVGERNKPQKCLCGGVMTRLMSVPLPAIFIVSNRERIVNTMNDEPEKSFSLPGKAKHGERYKQALNKSLFKQDKPVIGRGFGG